VHVWLITVGEPLPQISGNSRLWRTGLVAQELVQRGHTVTWWTSRVDHFSKRLFAVDGAQYTPTPELTIRFLDGRLYRRNVSIARLVNHWQIGRHFRQQIRSVPAPKVILCSFPTIELAREATRFGREHGIPVVLDVRDLWPDIFVQPAPGFLRGVVKSVLWPYFVAARRALADAAAIIAVSPRYLQWGLECAHRSATARDQVYPLAYSLPPRTETDRAHGLTVLDRYGVKSGAVVCLFAGTLGRTYDLGPVIECARRLASEQAVSPFHFVICGDGERAAEWRERAANLPNMSFTGWLAQDDMRAALAGADLGLAAYANQAPQGLPNKIIEYLAAGLPVLSSLKGEAEQLLARESCGVTYEADNATSLHSALLLFASPDTRATHARNARRAFETDFQAETVYAALATFLTQLGGKLYP
jgi:glycosyltransferase involved in cell wall biosynthesis